jgi:hypothetical protein
MGEVHYVTKHSVLNATNPRSSFGLSGCWERFGDLGLCPYINPFTHAHGDCGTFTYVHGDCGTFTYIHGDCEAFSYAGDLGTERRFSCISWSRGRGGICTRR